MSYRDERRADQIAQAEQAREDRRLELKASLKAEEIRAEQTRLDAEARAEQERRASVEKRRQQLADKRQRDADRAAKKAVAAAKRARRTAWLKANPATLFVAFVMVASIVPAVISQVAALAHGGVFILLAALLASMLEGGAWAITFMGKQAEDAGRPTGKYRAAAWSTAAAAAVIQFWHWSAIAPLWVALVFAGSSLFAMYIWDLKTHGSEGPTRAEKRDAKTRAKHLKRRRSHHKDVAKEADRLLSALPYGQVSGEEAFAAAWRIRHGAEPGMSATLYAAATKSRVQLGAAFELGERVRPAMLRNGMMAAALNPLSSPLPTFGPVSPVPALTAGPQTPTAQAGIGLSASEGPAAQGDRAPLVGRSDQELDSLLPDAHRAANELVAEGKPISAAGLAKKLKIRREDGMRLRDRVVSERKLRAVAAAQGSTRPTITTRIN